MTDDDRIAAYIAEHGVTKIQEGVEGTKRMLQWWQRRRLAKSPHPVLYAPRDNTGAIIETS